MNREEKNNKIKNSIKETLKRHSLMDCKTFEIKVVTNKMSKQQKDDINNLFKEAKWIRNAYLNKEITNDKFSSVLVKVKNNYERKEITLGSQIKQSIIKEIKNNIKGLAVLKKNNHKIGGLKFKSYCNEVELKQYGTTYKIDGNHIKVQNIKKPLYVRGLKQIPIDADICNAKLVRKVSGLYFYITCYVPKKDIVKTNTNVGIDFGIEHNLTLSNGVKYDVDIKESKTIKLLSKKLNRALNKNGNIKSSNHYKRINKLKKAYELNANKRKDKANKIVHELLNKYDIIAIQDEMLHNWQAGLFGKQIQHSAMGAIKMKLKNSSKVLVVSKSFPSTQICPICGSLTKHPLYKRTYDCKECGYHHESRDIKSAQSILDQALNIVSMERRAQSLVENSSSIINSLVVNSKNLSMKQEAQML